jgi:hypothetical protein
MLAAAASPALAVEGPGVRVDHAAARVIVIAEPRSDYAISINQGRAGLKPLVIRKDGGVTVVDGGYGFSGGLLHFGWDNLNCKGGPGGQRVGVPGKGDVAVANLPVVTIRAPLDARIGGSGAVYGEVNGTQALALSNAGCGDWRVADVHGPLHIALSGSGDVHAGSAGEAKVDIAGSSDVYLGQVNGRLDTHISGSGDIRTASVRGPVMSHIAGSGDVVIDGGDSPDVNVSIAGSGDFRFRGNAGAVKVAVAGSGDVDIAHASGPVTKHVAGSGDVRIGR